MKLATPLLSGNPLVNQKGGAATCETIVGACAWGDFQAGWGGYGALRVLFTLLFVTLLSACTSSGLEHHDGYVIDTRHPARGARPRVQVLVIHYTADDAVSSLAMLTGQDVSAHYLIPDSPSQIYGQPSLLRLVPETQLAWHAGASYWRGATRINDTSIGIELENHGYRDTLAGRQWFPFSPRQMAALAPLMRDIIHRYAILPQYVVGHSDIAPQRKQDPGPLFPWAWLAGQGIGAWPDSQRVAFYLAGRAPTEPVDPQRLLSLLARYGYDVTVTMDARQQRNVIAAFQMHFRARDYRGLADAESEAIAMALLELTGIHP